MHPQKRLVTGDLKQAKATVQNKSVTSTFCWALIFIKPAILFIFSFFYEQGCFQSVMLLLLSISNTLDGSQLQVSDPTGWKTTTWTIVHVWLSVTLKLFPSLHPRTTLLSHTPAGQVSLWNVKRALDEAPLFCSSLQSFNQRKEEMGSMNLLCSFPRGCSNIARMTLLSKTK